MPGIYEFGVSEFDAPPGFTGVAAAVTSHPSYSSGATEVSSFIGQSTLTIHPTFFAMSSSSSAASGMSILSRKPTFSASGTRELPVYHGQLSLNTSHPTIGPTSINGLFGWWKFASANFGYDSTNLMHTATLRGTATAGDGFLHLDGTSGYADVSDDPFDMGLNSFTIVVKAKPSAIDGFYRNILSKRNNSSYRGWSLFRDAVTNKIVFEASDTGNLPFYKTSSLAPMVANTEYHIAIVVSRETNLICMYVNGVLQQICDTTTLGSFNNTILLAFGNEIGQDRWKGTLRDIRFYKRGLSDTEVANLAAGNNLYGDDPVFGTFVIPVYSGNSTVSKRPLFTASGSRSLPPFGNMGCFVRHPTISSTGIHIVPRYSGTMSPNIVPQFNSNGVSVVPVYAGNTVLRTPNLILTQGVSVIPVYSTDFTKQILAEFTATGTFPFTGIANLIISHPVFDSDGNFVIPIYDGSTSLIINPVFDAVGVNEYRAFIYEMISYIFNKTDDEVRYIVNDNEVIAYMEDYAANNVV